MKRCQRRGCREVLSACGTGRRPRYCSDACRQAAYRARGSRSVHFGSATCEWATPADLFSRLDAQHGPFTLDACATAANAKCVRYFTTAEDGLTQIWTGRVWCNPPYGRTIGLWLAKAFQTAQAGTAELVVCLVPARVDTAWWNDYAAQGEVEFLRGRVRFGGASSGAPFPSAVVVFRNTVARYETLPFRRPEGVA